MDAKLAERMQRQNRILIVSLAVAGLLLIGLVSVILWLALRHGSPERNVAGANDRRQPRGDQANKLVGVWRTSRTIQGPQAAIRTDTSVEFRHDGSYRSTAQSNSATTPTITLPGAGDYTYSKGVLTCSGYLSYLGTVSVEWIGEDEFSTREEDGGVLRWTRGR
jgi:hypothetical protein